VSQELKPCSGKLVLNLEGATPAQRPRPYLVDIMDPCWIFPQADLTNVRRLKISVARLPFNFQLGADLAKVAVRTPQLAGGELDIRADSCAGDLVARLPLGPAMGAARATAFGANIAPRPGRHDLCLAFATGSVDPLWVIDQVELRP
jgi:hexosaminidase